LKYTNDKGIIYNPKVKKDVKVYLDASFAGDWDPTTA
jgi:hypothetical protein